jgi:ribose-phosphate pyrophosphokinase
MKNTIITDCGNSQQLAKTIAKKLKVKYSPLTVSSFPDGDIYLKFNTKLKNKNLIIINSFQPHSNKSLLNIIFAAETAKDLKAKKVTLVAPYLSFMRQDKRFHPGEAVSARIMAKLLNSSIDKIITIDPHLHRIPKLNKIFKIKNKTLTANVLIADYIKKHFKNEVVIGPDRESYQWAERIAKRIGVLATVLRKTRFSSRKVTSKMIKPIKIKNKNVIIVDDIISTGHTIIEAAKKAKQHKAKSIAAICVHGLFVENAVRKIKKAGVKKIISTNTIQHKTNQIDVSSILIKELKK